MKSVFKLLQIFVGISLLASRARALVMTGKGNEPVHDAGWPESALAVANLRTRVGWWEGPPFGGGNWNFQYSGDTGAFVEALAAFAAIHAPELELVIHDEAGDSPFLKDEAKPAADTRFDWNFSIWVPSTWHRLYNNPKSVFAASQPEFRQPVAPPRLDLYLGKSAVDFSKVKVPANIRLKDLRAAAAGVNPVGGAVVRADFLDMANGKPIAAEHLLIMRLPNGAANRAEEYKKVSDATSDAQGRAQAVKIPAGSVRISVSAPGYAPRMLAYDTLEAISFRSFQVSLAKVAFLRGIVVDPDDKPVPSVKVRTGSRLALDGRGYPSPDWPNDASVVTDATGHFTLAELPVGYTTLSANAEGYYFGDLFTIHEVPAATEVRLRIVRACKVHVIVTDKAEKPLTKFEDGIINVSIEPKDGAGIRKWSGSGNIKPDGTIDFTGMPEGEYRLRSQPNPGKSDRTYVPEQTITVTSGANREVTFVYP